MRSAGVSPWAQGVLKSSCKWMEWKQTENKQHTWYSGVSGFILHSLYTFVSCNPYQISQGNEKTGPVHRSKSLKTISQYRHSTSALAEGP